MNNKIHTKRVIQRSGCDIILPFVMTYIFYIILHGHLSPGGGFQGGVLVTSVVALLYLGHGYQTTIEVLSFHQLHKAEGIAAVIYVALAMLGVAAGAQFCANVLYTHGAAGDLYSSGTIFWMNLLVGLKVFAGVGCISLMMLSTLLSKDVDFSKE